MNRMVITHIKELYGIEEQGRDKLAGVEMAAMESIKDAFLLIENDKIIDYGNMSNAPQNVDKSIDASGKTVLPAWCDSHTHIIFHRSRETEFVDKLNGLSYEEIAAKGGGILNSARALNQASEDELYEQAEKRLHEVISFGTGAIEIKSGYGLSVESEIKMLRVARRLKENHTIDIKTTFLGAHAFPTEYKNNRSGYINLIEHEMLPRIHDEGLADYIDVFCEKGFFTEKETDYILKLGHKYNMPAKIHANQLHYSGGVQVGVANNARSVDHLEMTRQEEIDALKGSDTIATLLPSCSFFLGINYAPARKLIDQGLPVAIATDYNPGSTPSGKIPFVIALACIKMKMLPEEAIAAATLNGAYAMDISKTSGSISRGKNANFIITKKIPSIAYIPYAFGSDHIDQVFIKGKKQ